MSGKEERFHSILIVSGSAQFTEAARKSIPSEGYLSVEVKQNASSARRSILDKYYDLVLVNIPLPDESGIEFSLDVTEYGNAAVLIVVPREIYDESIEYVTGRGVLAIPKPLEGRRLNQAIRYLLAVQDKIRTMEKKIESMQEKSEELRLVNKAKFLLVEKKHMTEEEAHRFIGKQAMNHGMSRKRVAEQILDDLE